MGGHVDRVGNVEILERVRPSEGGGGVSIASLEQRLSLLSMTFSH